MAPDPATRARDWLRARHDLVCDVQRPWAHGTVVRATAYPNYYDFNLLRTEADPTGTFEDLLAAADRELAGLEHRRIDFELIDPADRLRAQFAEAGWRALRLVVLRHEAPAPAGPQVTVERVPYEAVHDLRVRWQHEDFPDVDPSDYLEQAREVSRRLGAEVFAVPGPDGTSAAFVQLERRAAGAEIAQVYVHPDHRGTGMGTAMTTAAIAAAGGVDDLWIVADDEDRPKELYQRLGFRPVWWFMEFTRWPPPP